MTPTSLPLAALSLAMAFQVMGAVPSRDLPPRTVPLSAAGTLRIETYKGTVKVATWEKPEVLVKARIEADDSCRDAGAEEKAVEAMRVKVETGGDGVRVESDYSHVREHWSWFGGCNARPFVHYEISMPRTASLRLKDYKSDSRLGILAGDVRIETYKGSVVVEGLDGGLDAQTYKGEIKVVMTGIRRDLRAETYKGAIEIVAPEKAAFTLDAESDRSEIDARGLGATVAARAHGRRGATARGDVNGGGPRVHLATNKGTLRVTAR